MKWIEVAIASIAVLSLCFFFSIERSGHAEGFSLKMVDDVIHDAYEKNTTSYYMYRIARDEKRLKIDPENLILYDDLAVGYDHIGKLEKALELYRVKRIIMEKRAYDMQNWYRYYANLGTFFIHDGLDGWSKNRNDTRSQNRVIEGKNYIEKAIEINVEAHFGRENYQLVSNTWLISTFQHPEFMLSQNMLGKPSLNPDLLARDNSWESCGKDYLNLYPQTKRIGKTIETQTRESCPMALKGILGMIRFGGGPNPFSFSTIGDILVAMGEYKIAFASYARAISMRHPNSDTIARYSKNLAHKIYPELPPQDAYERLLRQYETDYKKGSGWSEGYMRYQQDIILSGKDPTLDRSYNDFYADYGRPYDLEYNRKK